MNGLMMDFQLTIPHLLQRAETFFGDKEIVTRLPDRSFHRYTYADMTRRAKQLAVALKGLGLEQGDRVATLCWNHYQHMEAYFGIPCGGYVLHTLNLRLHCDDVGYIAKHAGDRVLIVDQSLLPLVELFKDGTDIEHVFVVEDSYEELLASANADDWRDPELDEDTAAAMCYTSGTTGMPKGVVYSHRSTVLHTLGVAAGNPMSLGISERDVILPVVPMFHANAWGYPYLAAMLGSKLVYPGQCLDPQSLLEDFVQEGVTWTAGVPTIWMGILQMLDADPGRVGSLADEGHARRRLGGAARDDRRLQAAPRPERRARLGDDRDVAGRVDGDASRRPRAGRRGDAVRLHRDAGRAAPVRRAARARRGDRRLPALGRRVDGRARDPRPVGRRRLLRDAGAGRPLDRRRLVQDGRHRRRCTPGASS